MSASLSVVPSVASRRLHVVHTTGFRYDTPVHASYNEARMSPLTLPGQTTLDARIEIGPVTWRHSFWDYWGTQVTAFDVLTAHEELHVVSTATVEMYEAAVAEPSAGWDVLRSDDAVGGIDALHEFVVQTPLTEPDGAVAALARDAAGGLGPHESALAVCRELHRQVDYVQGVTSVRTPAAEVWAARSGVCQDYAHLTLGALRSLGVPARYVSGYLHPEPEAPVGQTVAGESHAWVEWWAGEWFAFDPTHDVAVGTDYVVVARGRDYTDVTPLKGVYAGTAHSELFVTVEVTRLQ